MTEKEYLHPLNAEGNTNMRNRVRFGLLAIFAALGLAFSVTPAQAAPILIGETFQGAVLTDVLLSEQTSCVDLPPSNRAVVNNPLYTGTVTLYLDDNCGTQVGTITGNGNFTGDFSSYKST
jgi:hypothetical protein